MRKYIEELIGALPLSNIQDFRNELTEAKHKCVKFTIDCFYEEALRHVDGIIRVKQQKQMENERTVELL